MGKLFGVWFCFLLCAMGRYSGAQDKTTYLRATSSLVEEDKSYLPRLERPAYEKLGPLVLLDAGHRNLPFHQALSRLLEADGYRAEQLDTRFSFDALRKANILVIVNPGLMRSRGSPVNSEPIFTEEEAATVHDWVAGGGSLLVAVNGGRAAEVLRRFGVELSQDQVRDEELASAEMDENNTRYRVFTRAKNLMSQHKIMTGRSESEQIKRVHLQAINAIVKVPENAAPLLTCSQNATLLPLDALQVRELEAATSAAAGKPRSDVKSSPAPMPLPIAAAHAPVAIAFAMGKGRVVVLGDGMVLNAWITGSVVDGKFQAKRKQGLAEADNQQFALNIMHWLSGLLE